LRGKQSLAIYHDTLLTKQFDSVLEEFARIGKDGKTSERASVAGAGGSWSAYTESANTLIDNITLSANEVTQTIEAVAQGDPRKKMTAEVKGDVFGGIPLIGEKSANIAA
jgi:hypothetical protein